MRKLCPPYLCYIKFKFFFRIPILMAVWGQDSWESLTKLQEGSHQRKKMANSYWFCFSTFSSPFVLREKFSKEQKHVCLCLEFHFFECCQCVHICLGQLKDWAPDPWLWTLDPQAGLPRTWVWAEVLENLG